MSTKPHLIIACSQKKSAWESPLPAFKRYDGPLWRVFRKWLRENMETEGVSSVRAFLGTTQLAGVWALSAKYGLIPFDHEIEDYDSVLSSAALPDERILAQYRLAFPEPISSFYLAGGKNYYGFLNKIALMANVGPWTTDWEDGGIGKKQAALRDFLVAALA